MLSTWFRHMTEAGLIVRQLLEPEAESCPDRVFNNNRLIPMIRAHLLPSTLALNFCSCHTKLPRVRKYFAWAALSTPAIKACSRL
jgi:hypothetical protein